MYIESWFKLHWQWVIILHHSRYNDLFVRISKTIYHFLACGLLNISLPLLFFFLTIMENQVHSKRWRLREEIVKTSRINPLRSCKLQEKLELSIMKCQILTIRMVERKYTIWLRRPHGSYQASNSKTAVLYTPSLYKADTPWPTTSFI